MRRRTFFKILLINCASLTFLPFTKYTKFAFALEPEQENKKIVQAKDIDRNIDDFINEIGKIYGKDASLTEEEKKKTKKKIKVIVEETFESKGYTISRPTGVRVDIIQ